MINRVNNIIHIIQFTFETQINNIINFSDFAIIITHDKFIFSIHRKSTQTGVIIPNDSSHPYSQKISYFNSILYRLKVSIRTYFLEKSNDKNEYNIIVTGI